MVTATTQTTLPTAPRKGARRLAIRVVPSSVTLEQAGRDMAELLTILQKGLARKEAVTLSPKETEILTTSGEPHAKP